MLSVWNLQLAIKRNPLEINIKSKTKDYRIPCDWIIDLDFALPPSPMDIVNSKAILYCIETVHLY